MSIEMADFELIKHVRRLNPSGELCGILGDCRHYYPPTRKAFAIETGFKTIETFDINGNPTHKLDLNDEIPEEFHNNKTGYVGLDKIDKVCNNRDGISDFEKEKAEKARRVELYRNQVENNGEICYEL